MIGPKWPISNTLTKNVPTTGPNISPNSTGNGPMPVEFCQMLAIFGNTHGWCRPEFVEARVGRNRAENGLPTQRPSNFWTTRATFGQRRSAPRSWGISPRRAATDLPGYVRRLGTSRPSRRACQHLPRQRTFRALPCRLRHNGEIAPRARNRRRARESTPRRAHVRARAPNAVDKRWCARAGEWCSVAGTSPAPGPLKSRADDGQFGVLATHHAGRIGVRRNWHPESHVSPVLVGISPAFPITPPSTNIAATSRRAAWPWGDPSTISDISRRPADML